MKKTKRRKYNTQRIRLTVSYSVQEIAELFHLHKNAVLNWIRSGLPIIDKHKPYLVQGSELALFLRNKQAQRKQECKPDEFFCFKCKAPRSPINSEVVIKTRNNKLFMTGVCTVCGTKMNKAGSLKKLNQYQKTFSITEIQERHIEECVEPILNSEIRKDDEHEQVQP